MSYSTSKYYYNALPIQSLVTLTVTVGGAGAAAAAILWFRRYSRRNNSIQEEQQEQQQQQQLQKEVVWAGKHLNASNNSSSKQIYLDYNGTTPIYPDVLEAMMPFLTTHFGNPSSSHFAGRIPRQAVNQARRQILYDLLLLESRNNKSNNSKSSSNSSSADKEEEEEDLSSIWFTSCGTESDNLAIQLALQSTTHLNKSHNKNDAIITTRHIITCNVEHPAIEGCLKNIEERYGGDGDRCQVTFVPVQPDGRVRATDMIAAIEEKQQQEQNQNFDEQQQHVVVLVTMMLANNESGALQPVREVAEYCRQHNILFHTDAAQAAGKVGVRLEQDLGGADLVSIVGHKLGAPKGIACLYVRPGCLNEGGRQMHQHGVLLIGGGQEFGRRGGTENVPYIVGLGYAAAKAGREWKTNARRMEALRSRLLQKLVTGLGEDRIRTNGPTDPSLRLPNTLSVGIRGALSGDLLAQVGDRVAASAGATCHSASSISAVLKSMNVPLEFARGTLRLSVGPHTTEEEIDRAAEIIIDAAKSQLEKRQ